jgi:hypothetical protein
LGLVADFMPNPVVPPGASVLTLSGTSNVGPGSYDITLRGVAAPSAIEHDASITLGIFNAAPAAPVLTSPDNGAINQPSKPLFQWEAAAQGASYQMQVATVPSFAETVVDVSGLTETEYRPDTDFDTNTIFYWRVRATNSCGDGGWSSTWSFVTEAMPGDCGFGSVPTVHFEDDFESGATGWTHGSAIGPDTWALGPGVSSGPHSGEYVYHVDDYNDVSDQYLVTPEIALPAIGQPITLQFWNYQELEDSGSGCYDAGILEISTDGANWVQLDNAVLLTDPYDGAVSTCCSNPISGLNGWCGDPQQWLKSVVNLDDHAGQSVRFRFRLGTDSSMDHPGWDIDDVKVQSCVESGESLPFDDGFESGDTSLWSATGP